jgi:hypothetical protein
MLPIFYGSNTRMISDKHERDNINNAILLVEISDSQKKILQLRLEALLDTYSRRSKCYSITFHSLRITVTVGSLIVPALLSIQTPTSANTQLNISLYWVVWIISLFVTISNGCMTLLKVDKKYYNLNTSYQHFISETWQYIELSGKYSGYYTPGEIATHQNQYVYFCSILEKIQMKTIEDEFYKITDHNPVKTAPSTDSLIPPTPLQVRVDQKYPVIVNGAPSSPTKTTIQRIDEEEGYDKSVKSSGSNVDS